MQRPLHARIHRPRPNPPPPDDQTYVPTYSTSPAGTLSSDNATYPLHYPSYRAPRTQGREGTSPPIVPEKERIVPTQFKSRKQSLSRRDSEKHSRPVYEAPVTYGVPPSPSASRHRRRDSEPSKRIGEDKSKRANKQHDSLTQYGSGR